MRSRRCAVIFLQTPALSFVCTRIQERHHAVKAGRMGDETFRSQVLVRPKILLHILNQGYSLLWTDSDMVWLENPLPLLPDINDPEAVSLNTKQHNCEALGINGAFRLLGPIHPRQT